MVRGFRSFAIAIVAAAPLGISCRHATPAGGVDPDLAACVPADAVLLAGLNLNHIRSTPAYGSLFASALDAFRDASYMLVASNGNDFLLIARGRFATAPAGATLIDPTLAVAGALDRVRAAIAQHRTGRAGAPQLLARASGIPPENQIWAVAQGGAALPLAGNAANLNRLLRLTDYVTLGAKLDHSARLHLRAECDTAERARQFEETLRAIVSLAAAANARHADLATLLDSVQIRRDDRAVDATLSADAEAVIKLLRDVFAQR